MVLESLNWLRGNFLINYCFLPIFEVRNFLVNKQSGMTVKKYFDRVVRPAEKTVLSDKFCEALTEVEHRLSSKIAVPENQLNMLFGSLKNQLQGSGGGVFLCACDMLVRRLKEYTAASTEEFFRTMRSQSQLVPTSVAERLLDSKFPNGEYLSVQEAMKLISSMDSVSYFAEDKLAMYELLINVDKYIDIFEAAITPLVNEFNNCRNLLEPLMELYRKDYDSMDSAVAYADIYHDQVKVPAKVEVYPSFICCQQSTISFVDGGFDEAVIFMGVLRKFDENNTIFSEGENSRLYSIMNTLGNQSRFLIVNRLSKGPAYGRELSKLLGLSPGTISQHLATLAGFGLINVSSDGNRLYYSLNREQFRIFIDLQRELFLSDAPIGTKKH